jgi:hypothetical protein
MQFQDIEKRRGLKDGQRGMQASALPTAVTLPS